MSYTDKMQDAAKNFAKSVNPDFVRALGGGAGGGGLVVANLDRTTFALDKTWEQIHNAGFSVIKTTVEGENSRAFGYFIIIGTASSSNVYSIDAIEYSIDDGSATVYTFVTNSEDGYPVVKQG